MPIEIKFISWIQTFSTPFLDQMFEAITVLGESYIYIVLLSLFYWCVNKEQTRRILLALTLSVTVNGLLKEAFDAVRPIGVEGIRSLRIHTANGSSFPSGHTQTISVFMFSIMSLFKGIGIKAVGVVAILAVAFSRLYLGLHWPKDVLGAILVAWIIVQIVNRIYQRNYLEGDYLPYFIILVLTLASLFIFKSESYLKGAGILAGYLVGYWFEENFINFDTRGSLEHQILKYIMGIAGFVGIYMGLKAVLPSTDMMIFARYFVLLLWATAGAPALFVLFRLSKHRIF